MIDAREPEVSVGRLVRHGRCVAVSLALLVSGCGVGPSVVGHEATAARAIGGTPSSPLGSIAPRAGPLDSASVLSIAAAPALPASASIQPRQVAGQVIDAETGAPIAGVVVAVGRVRRHRSPNAERQNPTAASDALKSSVLSRAGGEFVIDLPVAPESHRAWPGRPPLWLVARHPRHVTRVRVVRMLHADAATTYLLEMEPAPVIAGRVIAADGDPAPSVDVEMVYASRGASWAEHRPQPRILGPGELATTRTDAAGTFELSGAPRGAEVLVRARAPSGVWTRPVRVVVGEETRRLTLQTWVEPSVSVSVRDESGRRVNDCAVSLSWPSDTGDTVSVASTGASPAVLRATFLEPALLRVDADGAPSHVQVVDLSDATLTLLRVTLRPSSPIEGIVVDDAGRPIPAAELVLWAPTGDPRWRGTVPTWSVRSGTDGRFRVANAPRGDVKLACVLSGYERTVETVAEDRAETRVVLQRLGGVRCTWSERVAADDLAVTVVAADARDDDLPWAPGRRTDSRLSPGWGWRMRSSADVSQQSGKLEIRGLPPGSRRLWIGIPGTSPLRLDSQIRAGSVAQASLVRHPAPGPLTLRVIDTRDAPVHDVQLSIWSPVRMWSTIATDADGEVHVSQFPRGPTLIYVRAPGYHGVTSLVVDESTEGAHVRLEPAREVRLLARRATGEPLPYCYVHAVASQRGWDFIASAETDARGVAAFELAPGTYVVRARTVFGEPIGEATLSVPRHAEEPERIVREGVTFD